MKAMGEYTKQSIMEKETFEELYAMEDLYDQADRLVGLAERAYDLGGDKLERNFRAKYKAFVKQKQSEEAARKKGYTAEGPVQTNFQFFEDGHELNCGAWKADLDGVYMTAGKDACQPACYHPILITKILKNLETKKQKVKLAYCIAGEWAEITVDKGMISSVSKITGLSEYGINATSENAKLLVRYLADLENMNLMTIERKVSSSKLGWINGEFIPYGMDVEFDGKERFPELFESVEEKGDFDAWMACMKTVRGSGRKEPLVYMAASFASILLEMMNLLSFVVNLWEETGKGKTVSMMVAASIWGNPKVGKFVTDVSSTGTSMEVRSDLLNNLPLFIDDLSKVKETYKDAFTDLIYSWCSGKGKDRSDQNLGLRRSCTWNNITMTSYERPLATENMRGGAVNRILDFQMEPGAIFTKETGNATVSCITKNYGFGGKMFVDLVKSLGKEKIRGIQQGYLKKIDDWCRENEEEKEDKQKLPLGVLLAADELAEQYIFKDGVRLDFEYCVRQLKGNEEVSENQRAYDSIMDDIMIHYLKFEPKDGEYVGEYWGFVDGAYVYIIPSAFKSMSERYDFSGKAFLQWAKANGLLLHDKEKNQKTARSPIGNNSQKFYALKLREVKPEGEKEVTRLKKSYSEKGEKSDNIKEKDDFVYIPDSIDLPFD